LVKPAAVYPWELAMAVGSATGLVKPAVGLLKEWAMATE
jgi:hypothetical protein